MRDSDFMITSLFSQKSRALRVLQLRKEIMEADHHRGLGVMGSLSRCDVNICNERIITRGMIDRFWKMRKP